MYLAQNTQPLHKCMIRKLSLLDEAKQCCYSKDFMDNNFNQDKVDYSDTKESYIWQVPVGYYSATKPCFIMDAGPRSEYVRV